MTATARPLAERIGHFASTLILAGVPDAIADRTRDRVLDALATALIGAAAPPFRAVTAIMADEPAGPASVLPLGRTASPAAAAFANAVACHAFLYEDLVPATADHPGCVIVPAALAAAESERGSTIGDLLRAVLAGYEVQLLLGAIAGPGVIARGFRTTSVFGTVAAAVASATIMRLDAERVAAAASIGANFAMGFVEGWSHAGHEPYFQAGTAAQQGLLAARLARGGATYAATAFEGPGGYLRAFADTTATDAEPGVPFRITDVICKPYPCSGGKIGAIDSARTLRAGGLDPADIAGVAVALPALYYRYAGTDRRAPFNSMSEAQASGRFTVAATLVGYDMEDFATFAEAHANPDIARLSQLISLAPHDNGMLARVTVTRRDGTTVSAETDRRDRLVPSIAAMTDKLTRLARGKWPDGRAGRVAAIICGPADRPVAGLTEQLQAAA